MGHSLPPETLTYIFSYLPQDRLASYATVCKEWQAILEYKTFSTLSLTLSRLPEFCRILGLAGCTPLSQCEQRRNKVRRLEFKVILPEYDIPARAHRENETDRKQNNQAFTDALEALWEALSTWPQDSQSQISLLLCSRSPSDWRADRGNKIARQVHADLNGDLLDQRYERSFLQLTKNADTLRPVDIIGELDIRTFGWRQILPAAALKIISRLPKVKIIKAEFSDNEREDNVLRDRLRQGI